MLFTTYCLSVFIYFTVQWAGYDGTVDASEAKPMFALKDGVSVPKQLAELASAEHRH
jgi:hypothetical protein